jgi:hypothetical protein
MFGFFRRPASRPLSDAIRRAIETDGMTAPVSNPSLLRMVESGGRYSDRKVTYFRVFDPSATAQQGLNIQRYEDFDVFAGLILRSGHVERDGTVVLTRPVIARAVATPSRTQADRAKHTDDAHIVRGETGATANPATAATSVAEQTP